MLKTKLRPEIVIPKRQVRIFSRLVATRLQRLRRPGLRQARVSHKSPCPRQVLQPLWRRSESRGIIAWHTRRDYYLGARPERKLELQGRQPGSQVCFAGVPFIATAPFAH